MNKRKTKLTFSKKKFGLEVGHFIYQRHLAAAVSERLTTWKAVCKGRESG